MDISNLDPAVVAQVKEKIRVSLSYVSRLRERLEKLGMSPQNPVLRETTAAANALQDCYVAWHYASIKHGVGESEKT